ncbi:MAG: ATP phosphoribosyltransferase regulatory subunit [Betaproteobacteria bacterium]|nr:MAG: ATP phosphoribosyltransferase regulatory subunit [Betaproteobacteria bacterium]
MRNWVLPEYIEDILPPEARRIELLRANLLELFRVHGYELVMPPLLEYTESLLTGTGHDMDLRTFKLVDQLSGRTMGVRADITPQVARIDAHLLNRDGVTRLCYCGSVLHTLPAGLTSTREPLQIGAEVYGHAGIESDLEIQRLLERALKLCNLPDVRLNIGHVAVFRALARRSGVESGTEAELFSALQAKDASALRVLTKNLDKTTRGAILLLPELYGGREVIARARRALPRYAEITRALADLEHLTAMDEVPVSIDLADLRGYHYHSGVVFAAYCSLLPNAIALGGRYDGVGKAFGRARPATGFTLYLLQLARLSPEPPAPGWIRAPRSTDPALEIAMATLRAAGEVVIQDLPGHESADDEARCTRELVKQKAKWQVRNI